MSDISHVKVLPCRRTFRQWLDQFLTEGTDIMDGGRLDGQGDRLLSREEFAQLTVGFTSHIVVPRPASR